jgi:hypothetical protein
MRDRYHRGIRQCLAAIVLVGNLVPPAYEHAHAGGQTPHRHGASGAHSHDHDDHHERSNEHQHLYGAGFAAAPVAHVHWTILIFELTWPIGNDDDRLPSADDLMDDALSGTRIAGQIRDCASSGAAAERDAIGNASAANCAAESAAWQRAARLKCPRAVLCDTARHERSGVQLI